MTTRRTPTRAPDATPAWHTLPSDPPPLHPHAFLASLMAQGIRLTLAEDSGLRCRAPKGLLTPELQAQIAHYKADLVDLLVYPAPAFPCPGLWPHVFLAMADGRRCVRCDHREEPRRLDTAPSTA